MCFYSGPLPKFLHGNAPATIWNKFVTLIKLFGCTNQMVQQQKFLLAA